MVIVCLFRVQVQRGEMPLPLPGPGEFPAEKHRDAAVLSRRGLFEELPALRPGLPGDAKCRVGGAQGVTVVICDALPEIDGIAAFLVLEAALRAPAAVRQHARHAAVGAHFKQRLVDLQQAVFPPGRDVRRIQILRRAGDDAHLCRPRIRLGLLLRMFLRAARLVRGQGLRLRRRGGRGGRLPPLAAAAEQQRQQQGAQQQRRGFLHFVLHLSG